MPRFILQWSRRLALAAVAWPVLMSAPAAPSPKESGPAAGALGREELADAVQWVDRLDWPDLHGKSYVELTFGRGMQGAKVVAGPRMNGFLLSEDEQSWTVFIDGTATTVSGFGRELGWPLSSNRFPKPETKTPPDSRTSIRLIEFPKAVDEILRALHKGEKQAPEGVPIFAGRVTDETALFLLARCCARVDQAALARRVEDEMLQFATRRGRGPKPAGGFRATLEEDLSTASMWKAVLESGDPAVGRAELLKAFETVVRLFPRSTHAAQAAAYVEQLRAMVAEDAAHAEPAQPLDRLTPEEEVRKWMFRLRDQHGRQITHPGSCEIFIGEYADLPEKTPAHHLVELGHAAVPALIEALRDARPTRSVGCHRDSYFSHFVLTMGDCAEAILSRIAGQHFWVAHTTYGAMQKDGETEKTRELVEAWWARVREKGEKAVLIENVRAGGPDSCSQAVLLAKLDPAAAVEAIEAGLAAATEKWPLESLVTALWGIKTADGTAALKRQMREVTGLEPRVLAASALFHRGAREVLPAMLAEWERWQPTAGAPWGRDDGAEALIGFLATCDDAAAMKALAARFFELPAAQKSAVLDATGVAGFVRCRVRPEGKPAPPEILVLGEELLVGALEDRAALEGISRMFGGGTAIYHDPRVCHLAAYQLTARWPERYHFTWSGTELERDRRVVEVRNVWRADHGQPALPLPESPTHEAAAREPNTVAAIRWSGGAPLRRFAISVGRPLSTEQIVTALAQLARERPTDRTGFHLLAERPGSRRGFVVEIRWETDKARTTGGWGGQTRISLGEESLHTSTGGFAVDFPDRKAVVEERGAVGKALAGPADQPISISYRGLLTR